MSGVLRITVLVSGGGTNLQAIIDGIADGTIQNTKIVGVISNNYGVYALERAEKAGIPAFVISPKDFASRKEFNEALKAKIDSLDTDLVVLVLRAACARGCPRAGGEALRCDGSLC